MVADVNKAKAAGVACIVDAGHPDMGRDVEFARQVSMQTGMPIVACAGFYSQPYYPAAIATMSEDAIVQAILDQIAANPTGALGEIGSWDEMTSDERKVFRAVGRVQVATNLPIITHTGIPGKAAIEQLNILEDMGVNPASVVIGHLGNLVDANVYVHKTLCRRGAFIGFDRQGGNGDAQVVPMVLALIDAGYADNLLFSADASSGYDKTLTSFIPKLKAAGANEEVLHRIMVDNPRRFLAFVPKG
jgi:phosphotriesterase-related protein